MEFVGVIVTYNRKELLLQNLEMLTKQTFLLDRVIIIDNHSTDGTQQLIEETFCEKQGWIDYRYLSENTGGAGGFYYGVKFAYESGADFIYLMDDDGRAYNSKTLEEIVEMCKKLYGDNSLLFLNSLVTTDGKKLSFGFWKNIPIERQTDVMNNKMKNGILIGKANPFNGTLISKELVKKIGYPRKEFFMSRDETDYMQRSIQANALVATVVHSIYLHPSSKLGRRKIFGYSVPIHDDLDKEYYALRNAVYTYQNTNRKQVKLLCLERILAVLFFENRKLTRFRQIKQAVSDAKAENMGKRK